MIHSTSFLYNEDLEKIYIILCPKEGTCAEFSKQGYWWSVIILLQKLLRLIYALLKFKEGNQDGLTDYQETSASFYFIC